MVRLDERLDEAVERLDREKADVRELDQMRQDMNAGFANQADDMKGVRRALWAFALALPVAGVTMLISVLNLVHH